MKIFNEICSLRTSLNEIRTAGRSIGLVPTMGALHDGHMALVSASKTANDVTISTIYVNPTQFNNPADLQKYPRTLERDAALLESAGCDLLFCPTDIEMYEDSPVVKIDFGHLGSVMEGAFRPGHFNGVALVVSKLFHVCAPTRAYFGQKDWQQAAIVKRLVKELKFDLEIVTVPIVREPDGLAMSSRNLRLSPSIRPQAPVLYQALRDAAVRLRRGENVAAVKKAVAQAVNAQPDMKLEYFEVADQANLTSREIVDGSTPIVLCIAAFAGDVRLIDNVILD